VHDDAVVGVVERGDLAGEDQVVLAAGGAVVLEHGVLLEGLADDPSLAAFNSSR
jgi:hypothetical protein